MKLICTNKQLRSELSRLVIQYPKLAFASAWASANTDVFRLILANKRKIKSAVIGTHFYQTDPDVLDKFVDSKKVKFIMQTGGVFHPKVYVFWDDQSWEILIGSANLTAGALNVNSELSTLITDQDGTFSLKDDVLAMIQGYFNSKDARTVNQSDADCYRNLCKLKARDIDRLAGKYGMNPGAKPPIDSSVMSMDWPTFLQKVKQDKTHGFNERIAMLKAIRQEFEKHEHFNDMDIDMRCGIAGLHSKALPNWGWFGSMIGAGVFKSLIKKSHPAFSLALDEVPLTGDVTRQHYDRFIAEYLKAYPNGRDGIATATRLLTMKRPDFFVCVDAANRRLLAQDIGITRPDKLDYERYWEEVILRLRDAPWWQSSEPTIDIEKAVWHGRSAMLDAIFYEQTK